MISCNDSKIIVVELTGIGFRNGGTVKSIYRYIPTNIEYIYNVKRSFQDSSKIISDSYYVKIETDTVFIGLEKDKRVHFLPYLLRNSKSNNIFDFNSILKDEGVLMGANGNLRKLNIEKDNIDSIEYYSGIDFGEVFQNTVKLGFIKEFLINSIEHQHFLFSLKKMYLVAGKRINLKGQIEGI